MFYKNKILAVLLGCVAFALTSCGSNETNSSSSSDSSSSSNTNPIGLTSGDGKYSLSGSSNSGGSLNYEIFVRSFYDSDGDGIGDFDGVASKASYLASLGVGTVWLMPMMEASSYHGYDVTDYYSVESDYGTMDDFENMIKTLSDHGIKVILDLVLNHSSKNHKWFGRSYNDYISDNDSDTSKKDWYNWSTTSKSGYSSYNGLYYEAEFDSSMPDFNFDSASLQTEFSKIMDFWLAKGISGFRLDAVRYYYYGSETNNIKALNNLVDMAKKNYPNTTFVGENWITGDEYYDYYASKIDSYFDFGTSISSTSGHSIISVSKGFETGNAFSTAIASGEAKIKAKNSKAYNSYFISNHDQDRSSKSLSGYTAKLAASITYLLPGTPFIYYGEEIGLKGIRGTNDGSDVLRRLPMIWSETDKTGECAFPETNRTDLKGKIDQVKQGADDLSSIDDSLVNHYKKVGDVRNKFSFIKDSSYTAIKTDDKSLMAYTLTNSTDSSEKISIVHNLSNTSLEMDVSSFGSTIVDSINTTNLLPSLNGGKLGIGGYSTVVLKG